MTINWKKIGLAVAILSLAYVIIIFLRSNTQENYFNQVELSHSNTVVNNSFPLYYDTILVVGLEEAGLKGIIVVMYNLTDQAKESFEGNLKAHIRYNNGFYYLFTDKLDRLEAIEVFAHEIVHISQYQSGDLQYNDGQVIWLGNEYSLENLEYNQRPWEDDAFARQGMIDQAITRVLYSK